jgi:short-subunit dehydrogenase
MKLMKKYNGYVLITGGSSGIGFEFAKQLAAQGYDLVLVAQDEAKLTAAANDILVNHSVKVVTIAQDLSNYESTQAIMKVLKDKNIYVGLLINNAGFGWMSLFHNTPADKLKGMINLMCYNVTELTYHLLPEMLKHGKGGIIFISSIAGTVPCPGFSVYGATKAYLLELAINLYTEYKQRGIDVLAVCPGLVDTEFANRANHVALGAKLTPQSVVRKSLAALGKKVVIVIPSDVGTRIGSMMRNVLPYKLVIIISRFIVKRIMGFEV